MGPAWTNHRVNNSFTIFEELDVMSKKTPAENVYSKPTKCLGCHLVVEMVHKSDADPVKGAWQCPRCGHDYPFAHWKIRKQAPEKPKAA